jgi:hypothetical protein
MQRGCSDFANVAWRSEVDNFVPDPGFIVEFDESQHFTALRAAALDRYPSDLSIGFHIGEWCRHCIEIDAHDKDPVDRDEKRAWYDTLRDFAPAWLGIGPTVRLFSQERKWCSFDPDRDEDVVAFRVLIEERLAGATDRLAPLIATITFRTDRQKGPGNNSKRLKAMDSVIRDIASRVTGPIVVVFPAGFLHSGSAEPRTLYNKTVSAIIKVISNLPLDILVVFGIDGSIHSVIEETPTGPKVEDYDRDQIVLAVDRSGLRGLARKYHPTKTEKPHVDCVADSDLSAGEDGFTRIVTFNGVRFFLAVCYDVYGGHQIGLSNPGTDVVPNPMHHICNPPEKPSGAQYGALRGFAGASKAWNVPVFGAVHFVGRPILEDWPTGVFWRMGEISTKTKGIG